MALPVFSMHNFESLHQHAFKWFTWVTEKKADNDVFAIVVDTEEFNPIFTKESILIIDPSLLPPHDDDYLAIQFENSRDISIRKYKIYDNENYLVPLNPQFKAVLCSEKKFNFLGVISEAHTKLREY